MSFGGKFKCHSPHKADRTANRMEGKCSEAIQAIETCYNITFKPKQVEGLVNLYKKKDVVACLPTGYGKSLIFSFFPILMDMVEPDIQHVAIVVMPVNSLMVDMVKRLQSINISVIVLESNIKEKMTTNDVAAVHSGQFSIVLTSPEVLLHENWKKVWLSNVYQTKCCLLTVDEAHCLTEWGNSEFRPHFRSIVKVRHILGKPCLLTTATLSTALYKDILNAMDLNAAEVVDVAIIPDRPNIFLDMRLGMAHYEIELDELISELQENQTKTPKTIIFCRNLPAVGQLHTYMMGRLDDKGAAYVGEHIPANALIRQYYAKVGSKVQKEITVNFAQPTSNLRVLITTVGFGMGVDIPDVKRIIHWGISNNPVWYWQEIGRAGRSGEESTALMYALPMTLSQKFVSNEMKDIVSSVKQGECVRATILNHLCLPSMNGVEKLLSEMKNRKGCTEAHQGEECGCDCCKCCNVCREKCLCVNL